MLGAVVEVAAAFRLTFPRTRPRPLGPAWVRSRDTFVAGVGLIPALRRPRFAEDRPVPVARASEGAGPVPHRAPRAKQADTPARPVTPAAPLGQAGLPRISGARLGDGPDRVGRALALDVEETREDQAR